MPKSNRNAVSAALTCRPTKRSNLAVLLILLCAIGGCATHQQAAQLLVADHGGRWAWIDTGWFDVATAAFSPPDAEPARILWVYLEGDGRAFIEPGLPALDPTPGNPLALRLAALQAGDPDNSNLVVWLAHPCQYATSPHDKNCSVRYWTDARYAPEIVASLNAAIDRLKIQAAAPKINLVGYSGGGALAVLLAGRRDDVAALVTIAGNLDLAYWTKAEHLKPLTGSLDPAAGAAATAAIPQWHFIGAADHVIGTEVTQAYIRQLPAGTPYRLIEIPGFTHDCCWVDVWPRLIMELLQS